MGNARLKKLFVWLGTGLEVQSLFKPLILRTRFPVGPPDDEAPCVNRNSTPVCTKQIFGCVLVLGCVLIHTTRVPHMVNSLVLSACATLGPSKPKSYLLVSGGVL